MWAVLALALAGEHSVTSDDCQYHQLAFSFALELQPALATAGGRGAATAVADGLGLVLLANGSTRCGSAVPGDTAAGVSASANTNALADTAWGGSVLAAVPAGPSVVWVDARTGSDRPGAGTEAAPYRTVQRAADAVVGLPPPRTILLKNGTHHLQRTVLLNASHSHTTITSAPGGRATVSGGVAITPVWTKDGHGGQGVSIMRTPVPVGMAVALELFDGLTNRRYVPARHPNGNVEQDRQSNYDAKAAGWLYVAQPPCRACAGPHLAARVPAGVPRAGSIVLVSHALIGWRTLHSVSLVHASELRLQPPR